MTLHLLYRRPAWSPALLGNNSQELFEIAPALKYPILYTSLLTFESHFSPEELLHDLPHLDADGEEIACSLEAVIGISIHDTGFTNTGLS